MPERKLPPPQDPSAPENHPSQQALPHAKELVHQLTNSAQQIISYLELNEPDKALAATRDAIGLLLRLAALIGPFYLAVDRQPL